MLAYGLTDPVGTVRILAMNSSRAEGRKDPATSVLSFRPLPPYYRIAGVRHEDLRKRLRFSESLSTLYRTDDADFRFIGAGEIVTASRDRMEASRQSALSGRLVRPAPCCVV